MSRAALNRVPVHSAQPARTPRECPGVGRADARLGNERYGAVGNDGGSKISPEVGRVDPAHVVGVHVNEYTVGGHYAAHQSPDVLVADIRGFYGDLLADD
jgi:hypothetical protein